MGAGSWNASAYADYSTRTATKTTKEIFVNNSMSKDLDPKGVTIRESRDSDFNPESTAIIVGTDVTGSMGSLATIVAKTGLGTLFTNILDRKPVSDPHLMFMAIGDAQYLYPDDAPLQVSQFEADMRIVPQLENIYVEQGGGGNGFESYTLPWYFAAFHTSIDCMEKRGKKGYLFTVGDESFPDDLSVEDVERVLGYKPERMLTNQELLNLVSQSYHVFHLMVAESPHFRGNKDRVTNSWRDVLGQRAVLLSDHEKMAEVIVSLIQVTEGADAKDVAASWSGDTSLVVANALGNLPATQTGAGAVTRL